MNEALQEQETQADPAVLAQLQAMNPEPVTELTEQEICGREALNDLAYAVRVLDPTYIMGRMHRFIFELLQGVASGPGGRRIILNCPPRHGKSLMAAIRFPAWLIARDQRIKMMIASYGGNLSTKHSRETLMLVQSPEYRYLFPQVEIYGKKQAADDWMTTRGGGYMATSIGGSMTGMGADLIIIDDPIKDFEQAHSPTTRESVWQWYLSTAYTRLSPTGSIIIIMTRWHEDDLVGRLTDPKRLLELENEGGADAEPENWEVIKLKAIAGDNDPLGRDPGEALFPEQRPLKKLLRIQKAIGPYLWACMFDQDPVARGGNYVNPDNFRVITEAELPAGLRWVRAWDLATDTKETSDFTASPRAAIGPAHDNPGGPKDCLYLAAMVCRQLKWPQARALIVSTAEVERTLPVFEVGVEAVAGFKTAFSNLQEVFPADVKLVEYGADKDKLTRALPWLNLTDNQKVYLVAGGWIPAFKAQVAAFPMSKHDDMVDGVSLAHIMLKSGRKILLA